MKITLNEQTKWQNVKIADRFFKRFLGLMGKKSLGEEEGLLILKCNQVHTFNMRFAIDVIYLTKMMDVVWIDTMKPGKVGSPVKKADRVLEVAAGSANQKNVTIGDRLNVI